MNALPKLSFLIAAHNEEKIIEKTLENLLHLPYENYEVIIGLDGCTDGTEKIVQRYVRASDKFQYYLLELRKGKPAVINEIIKKSSGEIIIINDADWIFKVHDRASLIEFISAFNDPQVGGIAESFPVEWSSKLLATSNLGFKITAYGSYYWFDYQKRKLTLPFGTTRVVKNHHMFLTNIFRRSLYRPNSSLGDDFERTYHIIRQGYRVVLFSHHRMPRMIATYNKVSIPDLFKQKIRTARARTQLKELSVSSSAHGAYISVPSIFLAAARNGIYSGSLVLFWALLTLSATITSRFNPMDTRKGWLLRLAR